MISRHRIKTALRKHFKPQKLASALISIAVFFILQLFVNFDLALIISFVVLYFTMKLNSSYSYLIAAIFLTLSFIYYLQKPLDTLVESTADKAYYFLLLGCVLQFIELKRGRRS